MIEVYLVVRGGYKKRKIVKFCNEILSKDFEKRNLVKLVARKLVVTSVTTVNLVTKLTTANTRALLYTDLVSYSLRLRKIKI
jgi:hypothetical protein